METETETETSSKGYTELGRQKQNKTETETSERYLTAVQITNQLKHFQKLKKKSTYDRPPNRAPTIIKTL